MSVFIKFMGELPKQKENSSAVISSSLKILTTCEHSDHINIPAIFSWIDLFREATLKNCITPA